MDQIQVHQLLPGKKHGCHVADWLIDIFPNDISWANPLFRKVV